MINNNSSILCKVFFSIPNESAIFNPRKSPKRWPKIEGTIISDFVSSKCLELRNKFPPSRDAIMNDLK